VVSPSRPVLRGARRRVRRVTALACAALAGLLAWLAVELHALERAHAINAAIARGGVADLAREDSPRGRLAAAWQAQRDGLTEEALALYGKVAGDPDPRVLAVLRFNLGNLYLARAAAFEASGERELSISLIEQAKENYRDLLRRDPLHWEARYNLSRALEMLPDLPDVHYGEEMNPERSPQAPLSDSVHERLP